MAGASHMDAAFAAKLARRSQLNHEAMTVFASMISGLVGLIIALDLLRRFGARKRGVYGRFPRSVAISRGIRSILLHKIPGFPSTGHLFVVVMYSGINIVAMFIKLDNSNMPLLSNVASRAGWMAISNTLIVTILALKNTPLAAITIWSHERLNILHRVAGFATVTFVIIHGCSYAAVFGLQGRLSRLTELDEIFGIIAGFSFLCVGFAGAIVRNWWYELFYYLHITFWMLGIVMVGLHQPEPSRKILLLTCTAAGIWGLDRLIRLFRLVINGANNTVTLTPLPHGGTRLVFSKPPYGATLAKHSFIWIPSIRALQTHPFTIVATNPVEFVVAAHDGFTRALHDSALQNPGVSLRASVEGPYGTFPNPREHDKIILVAGGSGASFTVGVALSVLEQSRNNDNKSIVFIWMIKHQSYLTWFSEHLEILKSDPRVSIHVYITRPPAPETLTKELSTASESSSRSTSTTSDPEKAPVSRLVIPLPTLTTDMEKTGLSTLVESPVSPLDVAEPSDDFSITYRRPDVAALIKAGVEGVPSNQRVLVMGCGPQTLTTTVRDATSECIRTEGPTIELHCEQFGW
ncbi:ferric reductase NAD binding domain-containing protein [Ilyonectria destructans]|nr:ferric reductase NAD binding domain-containing protein [Ilyonectria destructans]